MPKIYEGWTGFTPGRPGHLGPNNAVIAKIRIACLLRNFRMMPAEAGSTLSPSFLHSELQKKQELVESLSRQLSILQKRNQQLSEEKQSILTDFIEQKAGFEQELASLRNEVNQYQLSAVTSSQPRPSTLSRDSLGQGRFSEASVEFSRLSALNESLRTQLQLSEAVMAQNTKYEAMLEAQRHEINFLRARVDAFDFLKADYGRLSEEFETKSRVADSLAAKLAAYEKPPSIDIELVNFRQKVLDQLTAFTDALSRAFGWRVRQTFLGGFVFSRGDTEISVDENFRLTALKSKQNTQVPEGVQLPQLLALLTLADASN